MKESVLQYVWQHKLFVQHGLVTSAGQKVKVIDVGKLNTDGGPDFFNAKVQIGSTIWAGNVEVHVNSSDWYRHGHDSDDAYDSVILHVVYRHDQEVIIKGKRRLPQLVLRFPELIEQRFGELEYSSKWLACSDHLHKVPSVLWTSWKNALLYERLTRKVNDSKDLLLQSNFYFEEVFFNVLARSFGFSINGAAFDALARSLPWKVIQKNRNSQQQLEALLMGQSGLLFKSHRKYPGDLYLQELLDEYHQQQRKFGLVPIPASLWKWLRLRPENFPEVRIAQLASLLSANQHLFSDLMEDVEIDSWRKLLGDAQLSEYWQHHFQAGKYTARKVKMPGSDSLAGLIINAVIPVAFAYADYKGDFELKERIVVLMEQLPPENNSIIRNWSHAGVMVGNAADTQALIQLYRNYCEPKNCLRCRVGHAVLTIG
jgi:hypothetical protein